MRKVPNKLCAYVPYCIPIWQKYCVLEVDSRRLRAESWVGYCMGRLCFSVFTAGNIDAHQAACASTAASVLFKSNADDVSIGRRK